MREQPLIIDEELEKSLLKLVEYNFREEWKHFQEEYNIELDWNDPIETHKFTEEQKNHIYYDLVQLNNLLNKDTL